MSSKALGMSTFKSFLDRRSFWIGSGLVWILSALTGLGIVLNYETTPGSMEAMPLLWPANSVISHSTEKPELLMFVHPHCPCSRSSIGQLNALLASARGKADVHVLFVRPQGFTEEWLHSDLWKSASSIPDVEVLEDSEGMEAKKFHATVSGQTLLYDRSGRLLFNGGITDSRGHYGDNAGQRAVISFLWTGRADRDRTLAFGCSLFAPSCPMEPK